MDESRKKLFLLTACLIVLLASYALYSHRSSKAKPSSEMKTGLKVLTDPESVVKDLEK
jgi:hypothetical protein